MKFRLTAFVSIFVAFGTLQTAKADCFHVTVANNKSTQVNKFTLSIYNNNDKMAVGWAIPLVTATGQVSPNQGFPGANDLQACVKDGNPYRIVVNVKGSGMNAWGQPPYSVSVGAYNVSPRTIRCNLGDAQLACESLSPCGSTNNAC